MTFRTRLLAGFGVVVLVPLAVFGLGIRREMSGRVAAEYERRVGALADVIRADVARQSDGIAARLTELKGAIAADNRFRVAAIQGGDRAYVLDYAGDAMRLTGLDFLQVLDDEGRVVSSGHFRNEFDRPAPLPPPGGPALVSASTAEGRFLALVRTDSLRLGGRRFTLLGGVRVDSAFLSRLAPDRELAVSVALPGDSVTADSGGQVVAEVTLPYVASAEAAHAAPARIVVTHSENLLAAMRRNVNLWFAVAVLVSALLTVLIAGWLSTRFSRPMTEMERRVVMGDLARQVNHDIKNGLAPLRNVFRHFTEVAHSEPAKLPKVFAERQGTVESSIGYLETLAANYARLSPQTNERPTDVNTVVREALRHAAGADNVELRTELPDRLPAVRVDPLALQRVLENLLGNAVDSLEGKPGTVTVATERAGGVVRLSVGDTGRGMTKSDIDRAFDDFYTTKPGGTGLGLSIVRRLVLDAHGTLRVESEPGKGSKFIVELPTA